MLCSYICEGYIIYNKSQKDVICPGQAIGLEIMSSFVIIYDGIEPKTDQVLATL